MISFRLYYLAKDPLSKQGLHSEDEGLSHQLRELGQHSSTHNAHPHNYFQKAFAVYLLSAVRLPNWGPEF